MKCTFTVKLNQKATPTPSTGGSSGHKHHSFSSNNTSAAPAQPTENIQQIGGAHTGDNAPIGLLVCLIVLAGAGICVVVRKRRNMN